MANDYEIFGGKSLSDLFRDIYDNTETNRKQLTILTKELVSFIKDGDTAVQIVPMLKEYLEINVKNDDQLVKVAAIVQRIIAAETRVGEIQSEVDTVNKKIDITSGSNIEKN